MINFKTDLCITSSNIDSEDLILESLYHCNIVPFLA